MSIANRKGGFIRTLEVSQDDSSVSETVLNDNFLTKTNNYLCQVEHFISSNAQPLNTIDEVYFEVLARGTPLEGPGDVVNLPAAVRQFRPAHYFSTIELARQIQQWTSTLNAYLNVAQNVDETHITSSFTAAGKLSFTLYPVFSTLYYIRVGEDTRNLTGLREYIFVVNDGHVDIWNENDNSHLQLIGNLDFFTHTPANATQGTFSTPTVAPLSVFNRLLSLDVVATFPISTKPSVLNGAESNDYVLARFPAAAYQETSNRIDVYGRGMLNNVVLSESINTGLTDMTRDNTETISNHLLNGKIRHCNIKLENRYLEKGEIVRTPCDFTHGFFTIKLLFSKLET